MRAKFQAYGAAQLGEPSVRKLPKLVPPICVAALANVVFFIVLISHSYGLLHHSNVVIAGTVAALFACLMLVIDNSGNPFLFPIGVCCAAAVVAGSAWGTLTYEEFGFYRIYYSLLRTYHNVVPSDSSLAVSDGSRLVFTAESFLDHNKSAGFTADDGRMYCAAPVRDPAESASADFWAVGEDCCSWQGNFACDAAMVESARGGVVLVDRRGLLGGFDPTRFQLARRKAESIYGMQPTSHPVYIRWVTSEELDEVPAEFTLKVWILQAIGMILFAAASAPLSVSVCKPLLRELGLTLV